MAFNKDQFRALITDVLLATDLYSKSAVELLMLTCAVESNFGTYIEQITGPAMGVFQMEPATHDDIWNNFLKYKQKVMFVVDKYAATDRAEELKWNLAYAILMARVHYLRVPAPLPKSTDKLGLAMYWKDHYNTHQGKGTVMDALEKYEEYCI